MPASSGSISTYTQAKHNTSKDKKHNYKYRPYDGEYYRQSHQMAFQRSSAQLHSEVEEVMSVLMDFQPGADDYLSDRGQIFEYTMHMSIRRWCHLIHSTRSLLRILKKETMYEAEQDSAFEFFSGPKECFGGFQADES